VRRGARAYRKERKWGTLEERPHTVGEWLLIAEAELQEAKQAWVKGQGVLDALGELLQSGAVVVAALEQHGVYERPWGALGQPDIRRIASGDTDSQARAQFYQELAARLLNSYAELFPRYAYTSDSQALHLIADEVKDLRDVLAELVRLKDERPADYEERKEQAWEAVRHLLARGQGMSVKQQEERT
jgi:hypothetical protein